MAENPVIDAARKTIGLDRESILADVPGRAAETAGRITMSDSLTERVNAALEGIETWDVVGDWVAARANQCTCWGGDAHYGHQPGCGYELVGKVDEPILKLAVAARELLPELCAEVERLRAASLFVYHVTYWDPCNGIGGHSQSHGYFATEDLAKAYVEPRSTGWDVNAYTITAIEVKS